MTLNELDTYFRAFLKIEDFSRDVSLNGIQIQNSEPDSKQIKKIAFAVDACAKTVQISKEQNADLLFVHHGIFWGGCERIVDNMYKRVAPFIKNDIALYACHIPLDANNPYGNNYGLAARIGLKELEPFGEWRGMISGVKGKLEKPVTFPELVKLSLNPGEKPFAELPFGKKEIQTVGIISGGSGSDVVQAIEQGLDAYISGDMEHALYHTVLESGINMIALGHYQSETIGINLVREKVEKELKIETVFIDIPTGL